MPQYPHAPCIYIYMYIHASLYMYVYVYLIFDQIHAHMYLLCVKHASDVCGQIADTHIRDSRYTYQIHVSTQKIHVYMYLITYQIHVSTHKIHVYLYLITYQIQRYVYLLCSTCICDVIYVSDRWCTRGHVSGVCSDIYIYTCI